MKLYITEKPSIARAIVNVLSPNAQSRGGIFEFGDTVVVPLQGHVLEQLQPHEYEERYKQWRLEDLPIIPKIWKKKVQPQFKDRVSNIGRLLKKAKTVVHAGDPDREGQLIVDEVLEYLGYTGRVLRIHPNSAEEVDLREILRNETDNAQYFTISEAGRGRERRDYITGINPTRAATKIAEQQGYRDMVFSIGRVQTPTLALVVRRERAIESFVAVDHYTIRATFTHSNGTFEATWKPKLNTASMDDDGRILDRTVAEAVLARISGAAGRIVVFKDDPKKTAPPLPFSLNALQKEASSRFKIAVGQVKDIAQQLYDPPLTLTTYPRSDSRYLPPSQHELAGEVIAAIGATSRELAQLAAKADPQRRSAAFKQTTDPHHAIVPTRAHGDVSKLSDLQRKLYDLVARTYLAQFYPPYEYRAIVAELDVAGERFVARGKIETAPGWRVVLPAKAPAKDDESAEEESAVPPMALGDTASCSEAIVKDKKTSPPGRFTQATLVDAMEHVDKYVDDPELKARLKAVKGIGTPATQDSTIDTLLRRGYLEEEGGRVYPTPAAMAMIAVLEEVAYALTDPGLTALMEQSLEAVADGRITLQQLMAIDERFAHKIVADLLRAKFPPPSAAIAPRAKGGRPRGSGGKGKGKRKCSTTKRRKAS